MAKLTQELTAVRIADQRDDPDRFRRHKIFVSEDYTKEYFETWDIPQIEHAIQDTYHEVTSGEEGLRGITLLSYRYYRRVDLWWIIAVVNNIYMPSRDMKQGLILRIPSEQSIARFLV